MRIWKLLVTLCLALTVSACGTGSSGSSNPSNAQTASYKLVLTGTVPAGGATGLQFNLLLPAGFTLNVNTSTSEILSSSLAPSGSAPSDMQLVGRLSGSTATIGIVTIQGVSVGEFATITGNLSTATAPAASAFTIENPQIIDTNGNTITTATIVVQSS